ncbi:MAG TPA: alpha/beta fold hydrolase [Aquihabitans sp.]|jgi:pimeloyl-ACP methyl ester carboxylesterase|nr:alpha/beta fold hydrolase [Aquihabitans sp.]
MVLLPGVGGHAGEFGPLIDALDLGPALRVLAVDPPAAAIGLDAQAREVVAGAGPGPHVVLGHSQGGLTALRMAAMYPEAVAAVVVLDSPVLVPRVARTLLGGVLRAVPSAWWPALTRCSMRATFDRADDERFRSEVLRRLAETDRAVMGGLVRDTFTHDGQRALTELRVPGLYVRANIPTPLHRLPAGIATADVRGVGHLAHVHRPHEVAAAVHAFFASLRADGTPSAVDA